ncbi:MAG: C2H2-type zinc finger protein [Haloarculaceae archaeon]
MTDETTSELADDYRPPRDFEGEPVTCRYCGRPFAREDYLALHRAKEHADALDADDRAAYEDAREAENDQLRTFRLLALGVLVLLYFGLLMTYAVFT